MTSFEKGDRIQLNPSAEYFPMVEDADRSAVGSVIEAGDLPGYLNMVRVDFPGIDSAAWYPATRFVAAEVGKRPEELNASNDN